MPMTEFSPSIPSRPTYAALTPKPASSAIMIADADGAEALVTLAAADASIMTHAHVVLIAARKDCAAQIAALGPVGVHPAPDMASAKPLVTKFLSAARMGTRLYLAGSESLIGWCSARAYEVGMAAEAIQAEHRGTVARAIQCVHCKGVTENVTTDPFACAHCGLTLFVRDHFSRRLGVFQGVCVDAETPGVIPQIQEIRA